MSKEYHSTHFSSWDSDILEYEKEEKEKKKQKEKNNNIKRGER